MKKLQIYVKRCLIILVVLTIILLISLLLYFLYNQNYSNVSIVIALVGVLSTVCVTLIPFIYNILKNSRLIERCFYDDHFVDREKEYVKLENLIKNENNKIIYIKGSYGMGKTLFVKMSCDRINFTNKKSWKQYSAFYFSNENNKQILQSISNKFLGHENATILDISNRLNKSTLKNCILFIDNKYKPDINSCVEFAKAFINCNKNNKVVITLDGSNNTNRSDISLSVFKENEIDLLIDSYNTTIQEEKRVKITQMASGYPVYARFIIEAINNNIDIIKYDNLDSYIEATIDLLTDFEKESLSLIVCLIKISKDANIKYLTIHGIDNRISEIVIKRLVQSSLINRNDKMIFMNETIAYKCMEFLTEFHNNSYQKIYEFYKKIDDKSYIALSAALQSNFKYDNVLIKKILHKQYEENNFHLLLILGEIEFTRQINPYLREDMECLTYLKFYYLKSLLELGFYDKARIVVDDIDNDCYFSSMSLLNLQNDVGFDYHYLLIDLDHLTNKLEDAKNIAYALSKNTSLNPNQKAQCDYLYAHCIRHIGEDLEQAYAIFINLANDMNYKDDKIRIRSIYSAISIKMFQRDLDYPYEKEFEKIGQIINSDYKMKTWKPYVIRHKAIYFYKILNDYVTGEQILKDIINELKVTSLRIKYDIYFELGEIYRLKDKNMGNYKESLNNYEEALQFSKRVNDYNLESCSLLGIMLLNIKYGYDIDENVLKNIILETKNKKLNINFNYAQYIKYLINDYEMPDNILIYWKNMQYSDLFLYKNKSERCNLKITVM